jgi:hypothetical protein
MPTGTVQKRGWRLASFVPSRGGENSWAQVAATAAGVAAVFALALIVIEPANGNQTTAVGLLWWLAAYLLVVVPLYLALTKLLGRAALVVLLPIALVLAVAELGWYAGYCVGSW